MSGHAVGSVPSEVLSGEEKCPDIELVYNVRAHSDGGLDRNGHEVIRCQREVLLDFRRCGCAHYMDLHVLFRVRDAITKGLA